MYNRVVCMNGRYGISITREGYWAFIMREGGLHEVSIKVCPVEKNKWTHVVGTYDGTNLRVYIDSWLVVCVEVAGPLRERRDEYYEEYRKKRKELKNLETAERESIKGTAKQQSDDFFLTKDGIQTMNRLRESFYKAPNSRPKLLVSSWELVKPPPMQKKQKPFVA